MNIGTIRMGERGSLVGSIATIAVAMRFVLRPVQSSNTKAPAFEICTRNPAGVLVQVGALWEQTSKATGECFLQGRIDDPSMVRPLAINAFRQDDGSFNIAWLRPQRRAPHPFGAPFGAPFSDPANDNRDFSSAA